MRNIIVHLYNQIEEDLILNSVEEVKNILMKWLDEIEGLLEEFDKS